MLSRRQFVLNIGKATLAFTQTGTPGLRTAYGGPPSARPSAAAACEARSMNASCAGAMDACVRREGGAAREGMQRVQAGWMGRGWVGVGGWVAGAGGAGDGWLARAGAGREEGMG